MSGYYHRMAPPWFGGAMIPAHHPGPPHGFCHSCAHPVTACTCSHRECRKEAKELLVAAQAPGQDVDKGVQPSLGALFAAVGADAVRETADADVVRRTGSDRAFIGGGCCVHLSIEYTAQDKQSAVVVLVTDAENIVLAWGRHGMEPGYYVKEGIISTNPGATLQLQVLNTIARVRWCEVFSC